jgi:L-ascorbate metabolism protein UlaG (beta-lactamase superfamily)
VGTTVGVDQLSFTWWGHSSTTVDLGATRVMVDPLLSDWLFHLRRYAETPPSTAHAGDVVLVSHLHPDHLHVPTLRRFPRETTIVVPLGAGRLLTGLTAADVRHVAPGDSLAIDTPGGKLAVNVLPATHDGRRHQWSRHGGVAVGYRLATGHHSVWFPGDTELRDDMHDVAAVDLALAPVGGWGPTLGDGHMDPAAAAEAVVRVGARWAVPVHWGTFWPAGLARLAPARHRRLFTEPGERFREHLASAGRGIHVVVARHGERVVVRD